MRISAGIAVFFCALFAPVAVLAQEEPGRAQEILMRAKSALAAAGTIKAALELEVNYPSHYKCAISILASPTGDERAEIRTTVNENSYTSLEVISKGVMWSEQHTPAGPIVTKIDINQVKKALREDGVEFAALPVLGTNLLFDLGNLARLVKFDTAGEAEIDSGKVLVISGALIPGFAKGKTALPTGAERYYASAKVYLDPESFLPRRMELGEEDGKPLLALDFKSIEKNAEAPPDAFAYTPPEDTEVIDRTQWAIGQFRGE
jgi:hypothetical protein